MHGAFIFPFSILSEVARVQLIENQQRKSRIHESLHKTSVRKLYIIIDKHPKK